MLYVSVAGDDCVSFVFKEFFVLFLVLALPDTFILEDILHCCLDWSGWTQHSCRHPPQTFAHLGSRNFFPGSRIGVVFRGFVVVSDGKDGGLEKMFVSGVPVHSSTLAFRKVFLIPYLFYGLGGGEAVVPHPELPQDHGQGSNLVANLEQQTFC